MAARKSAPRPVQFTPFRKEQFQSDEGISFFNQQMAQIVDSLNRVTGQAGQVVLPAGIDVQGGKLSGLAAPTEASDAVSLAHATGNYSAPAVGPQLDIGGSSTLKGLATCYGSIQPGLNITATLTLAKITGGGQNGSIQFQNGVVTNYKAAS